MTRSARPLALVLTVVAVAAAGCTAGKSSPKPVASASTPGPTQSSSTSTTSRDDWSRIPQLVTQVEPSVVTITTSQGLGSGVIYSSDGLIVTDAHVVAGATTVQIAFADGKQVTGTVLGGDTRTDVAIVRADRKNLPAARFQPKLPQAGELDVVIGSPLGLENTVTAGIISGLHRNIPGSGETPTPLVDLIQTDAPISPGNSGGAVINGNGEVVGLSEAYIPPSQGAVALGFATPTATVLDVVKQLQHGGSVQHAFLGIGGQTLTPQIAQDLGTTVQSGVVIAQVTRNGPAASAGLRPGDIITKIDSTPTNTYEDLIGILRQHKPGDTITITFVRNGSTKQVTVKLSDRPSS